MAGMLNDSQLAAVNDVTDLLPHAGTWGVVSTSYGGDPNVAVFAFVPKDTVDVASGRSAHYSHGRIRCDCCGAGHVRKLVRQAKVLCRARRQGLFGLRLQPW